MPFEYKIKVSGGKDLLTLAAEKQEKGQPANPIAIFGPAIVLKTGDTVQWSAEDGAILIRFFEGSPFASKETEFRADSNDALNTKTPEKVVLGDGKTVESYKYTIVWSGVSEYSGKANLLCDDPHIIIDNNLY